MKKNKKIKNRNNDILKVFPYYFKNKWLFFLVILLSLIYSCLAVFKPILEGKLLNTFSNFDFNTVIKTAGILALTLISINLVTHIWSETVLLFNAKVNLALKKDIFDSLLNLKLKNFNKVNSGIFVTRINQDSFEVAELFDCITDRVGEILTNIALVIYCFIINYLVGIFVVVNMLLIFLVETIGLNKYDKTNRIFRKNYENMQGTCSEVVRGIKDIKGLNLETEINSYVNKNQKTVVNSFRKRIHTRRTFNRIRDFIQFTLDFLFVLLCSYLIIKNKLTVANFLIVFVYKKDIVNLIKVITIFREELSNGRVSASRIFDIIDYRSYEKEDFGNEIIENPQGKIEFKNVSFKYNSNEELFNDLNFIIPENKVVAFVGKSGEGKSTILDLINKNYDIDKGEILIDDKNITNLSKDCIRNNISYISQFPYLFNLSIKENLKLVKPEATDEEIIEVCKQVGIHNYIIKKEDKYDSIIGENGVVLSGGQKQRIAIARALLKNSKILLFDEATSALDNQTQNKIKGLTKKLAKDHTIIIVAHRLSTIINSDIIYVIDNHKIIASGTHNDLINNCEVYKEIYNSDK